jgi:osmoprotectant transport system ATP-binding protein
MRHSISRIPSRRQPGAANGFSGSRDVALKTGPTGNHALTSDTKPSMSPKPSTIELVGVTKCFGSLVALEQTDLVFEAGKTTILIGPSGCGKSTILRLIVGLLQPTGGRVRFEDRMLSSDTILSLRRRMGYVIQEGGLFPHLTARQNILLLATHLRQPQEEMCARLAELCELTRLASGALSRYPLELSGGQRQRVSLIRALMLRPDVLLLDEPLAALDPMVRATLQMELKAIFQQICQTVIFVTHDLAEAAWLGDRIVLLREGRVVQSGTFAALREQPATSFVSEFINAQRKLALV